MCVNCSGIHRMLGTHISRVKSCRLDQWADEAVQVQVHCCIHPFYMFNAFVRGQRQNQCGFELGHDICIIPSFLSF